MNEALLGVSSCEHKATVESELAMLSAHMDKKSSLSCCPQQVSFPISEAVRNSGAMTADVWELEVPGEQVSYHHLESHKPQL